MALNIKEIYDNNEIIPYKNKVMNVLTSSETLYELVTNQSCEDIELSEELVRITGEGLDYCFYADNGSSCIESALKMSMHYWRNIGEPDGH